MIAQESELMAKKEQHSPREWAEIEAAEHDELYENQFPFGLKQYEFSIERALWYEDYCYKKGRRRDRGHRTRKFLELVDLSSLNGKRVLDIGCGIGQYSVLCAKSGAEVTGIDLSPVGIGVAKKIAGANRVEDRCNFLQGDFCNLGDDLGTFDVVMLHEVLHHAIKYPGLEERISAVTKPGSKIVIADTVRGGGLVHLGRHLVKFFRYLGNPKLKEEHDNLGDVLFTLDAYHEFGRAFRSYQIYPMSYLYMIKQTDLQYHLDKFYVRWFLRIVRYVDDGLLALCPPLRSRCGEAVLYIEC